MSALAERLAAARIVLTDGGIETRLIYEYHRPLPDFASFLPLFDPQGRPAIEALYAGYMAVAAEFPFLMQIGTPTWRAHPEGLARQGFTAPDDLRRVNAEAVVLLRDLRRTMALEERVIIAGVIGPRRDGYDPAGAPDARPIMRARPQSSPASTSTCRMRRPSRAPRSSSASRAPWRRPACPMRWRR
jgi:S-methylmethionine-dependent homocysteine/selenocysteine methylase